MSSDSTFSLLVVWGSGDGPLFHFKNGQHPTCPHLAMEVRKALQEGGLRPETYTGPSFRIGVATTAAACGVSADAIKTLGHWKSQAYQLYSVCKTAKQSAVSH